MESSASSVALNWYLRVFKPKDAFEYAFFKRSQYLLFEDASLIPFATAVSSSLFYGDEKRKRRGCPDFGAREDSFSLVVTCSLVATSLVRNATTRRLP